MSNLSPLVVDNDTLCIMNLMPDAVLLLDSEGLIIQANAQAETMFAYSELPGNIVEILIPERFRDIHLKHRQNYYLDPLLRQIGTKIDLCGLRKDGSEFPVEITLSSLNSSNGPMTLSVIKDVSERNKLKEEIVEQTRLAALSASVGSALVKSGTMPELLQMCAQAIVDHLGAAFARIWIVDESGHFLLLRASAGLYTHLDGGHSRIEIGQYKVGLIASEKKPHLTNDVPNDPRVSDKEWAKREGMVAFAGHPLMLDDKVVGVMAMFAQHVLTDSATIALRSISDQIALGINAKLKERADQELASVLQSSNDAIISLDLAGKIIHYNLAAEQMYGYSVIEAMGQPLSMLVPADKLSELYAFHDKVKQGEYIVHHESIRHRKDGTLLPVSVSISAVKDYSGKVIGISSIARDITEQKQREEAEKQILVLQEREDFMFTLTHDLKNPLIGANHIIEQIAAGQFGAVAKEPAELLLKICASNESLIGLIQNIIDVYRNEIDTTTVSLAEINPNQLVEDCIEELALLASSRAIKIQADLARVINILADGNAIRRVVHNLLDNAIKFSPEGEEVKVSLYADQDWATLKVVNIGAITSPEDMKHLFQRFWQGSRGKKYVAGSGLGLYLCSKIVSAHNGTISCTSNELTGTTFCVKLPMRTEGVLSGE